MNERNPGLEWSGPEQHRTLQPKGKDAEPKQVQQVRDLIVKYGIGGEE